MRVERGHYWVRWEFGKPPKGLALCVEPRRWGYVQLLKRWGLFLTTSGARGYRRRAFHVGPLLVVLWRKH